jgi:hypothetical protein
MNPSRFAPIAAVLLLAVPVACVGQVEIAKNNDDAGHEEGNEGGSVIGNEAGSTLPLDAGWDGWSGAAVGTATGPAPACSMPALACGAAFPGEGDFANSQEAANALVGKWSFCGQTTEGFYPAEQVGEEYASDGTYYELIAGSNGQMVRNMDPANIGTWQIDLTPNGGVEVHTFGGDTQRGGGLSSCPPALDLLFVETKVN